MNDTHDSDPGDEHREQDPPGPPGGSWVPPPPRPGWTAEPTPPGWTSEPHQPGGWRDPGPAGQGPPAGPPPWNPGGHPPYPPGPSAWGGGAQPGGWNYGWGTPRARRTLPGSVTALLLAVAVLVGLGIGHGVWRSSHASYGSGNGSAGGNGGNGSAGGNGFGSDPFGSGNGAGNSGSGSGVLGRVAAQAANALVDINTSLSYQNGQAAGTGIVLSDDGYVLTNNHVISGATTIKATDIGNGKTYTASVVGYDRTHDVAVVKLADASGLTHASIGSSSRISVGQAVVGLGNAGGVGGTPSSANGQVTALDQSITAQDESNGTSEKLTGLIETDANIQPGDSGGALIDSAGAVIGMDTAASTGFSFQAPGNQGFAIPIDQAMSLAGQIRGGKASATIHVGPTAFLGVAVDTTPTAAGVQGAVVSQAIAGGAAAQAGLAQGDVITSLGGVAIDSPAALTTTISRYHPGDQVTVVWRDAGAGVHQAQVTLAAGPAQ